MAMAPERIGIGIHRHFTAVGVDPFDTVRWERRDARITNYLTGAVAFEQLGVEVPSTWSVNATNILAQKYFRGTLGTPEREWSLKQVTCRVVDAITEWGRKGGYFVDDDEAEAFRDELTYLIIHQRAAFNSPVWFNIGVKGVPQQASACFILSVDDSMSSILNWYVEEGTIFKGGSGSGINLSKIRSSKEGLRGGGTASGPVSFMRGADASAGTIKCLHEDTPIVTTDGVRPIRAVEVGSLVPTRSGLRPVLARHDNGVRPLVRVLAATGEQLLCTPEHRFWVRRAGGEGWQEAGRLQPGDAVLLDVTGLDAGSLQPLVAPADGHHNEIQRELPTVLDQPMALWLGWLAGDGSITRARSANFIAMQLGDDDPELGDRYRAIVRSLFGDVNVFASRHADKPDASESVRFCSTRVIRFLEVNGLLKGSAGQVRIPDLIAASPAPVRAAFLAGLFEADGHVGNGYAWLSTVSDDLATGAQRLLHSLGIPTWRGRIDDRRAAYGVRPVHTVRVVGGEGMRRFAKLVGFVSERKSRLLDEALARRDASTYETQWFLPHAVAELNDLWAQGDGRLRRALAPYCRYAVPRSFSLLRARVLLQRFPEQFEGTVVDRFARGDEFWTPVTVEDAGTGPTYDLTVEDAHEYFVHNLVTHNSGGKTRRAAKMVILNVDHPDIEDFIWCKAVEETKARALRDAGFDMDLDGKDSHSIQYQNANNSVRVTDEFMEAVLADTDWHLKAVTTGETIQTVKARDLFRQISKAAWECADPGMQFDTTINRWHTAPATGRINGSNPCSEYMHLDDSACNLSSLNLLTFLEEDDSFDVTGFTAATELMFTAQEILVGNADYPTKAIGETSRRFRQLGIGYANLGALLMAQGVPYDSDEGRAWASAITALLTGTSYATSARTAARMGPFAGFTENRDAMLNVLRMHRDQVAGIDEELVPPELLGAAQESWDTAVEVGEQYGVRNSQASVLAPTGTIALLMDCDTTGIEPDLGLVKTKKLVGGGTMSIVNQTVPRALRALGYSRSEVEAIIAYIDEHKSIVGAPALKAEHLPVFACSMGDNTIHYRGHVRMMGAVQPFISGAISKCVTGDTVLSTADGLVRIGTLYRDEEPDSYRSDVREVASLSGPQKTDAFYYGGVRPVTSVVLRSGHRVTGTANHRLLVSGGAGLEWRRLDEIAIGEYVATQYGDDLWSVLPARIDTVPSDRAVAVSEVDAVTPPAAMPVEMSSDLAFVLGAFAAAGRVAGGGWSVHINCDGRDVLERLAEAVARVFGVTPSIRRPGSGLRGSRLEFRSQAVVELFDDLGCGQCAAHKRVPDAVLRSPREMVLAYLQGLFLSAEVTMCGTAKWAIRAESPGLLDDLQAVLTNLGIVHERVTRYGKADGQAFDEVFAVGEHAHNLLTMVPFLDPHKAAFAQALQGLGRHPNCSSADVVPGISPYELYRVVPRAARSDFSYLSDPRAMCVSRRSLEQVAAVAGPRLPQWVRTVLENNLHFSPVESVGSAGECEVFDLSVPTTQAFVGNGIVNHNTVNLPEEATIDEIEQLHIEAWHLGLKAVAIYRDNCKVGQPLSTTKKVVANVPLANSGISEAEAHDAELALKVAELEKALQRQTVVVKQPLRERLPRKRRSMTFKFRVADCEGYVTVGEYDDGRPGEVFMKVSKQGSTLAGIMDAFSVAVSLGLQHGVPLATFVKKYTNMRFEPAGMTDDRELRIASSLVDYIFRRLALDYLAHDERAELGIFSTDERLQPTLPGVEETTTPNSSIVEEFTEYRPESTALGSRLIDAPYCYQCGVQMQRAGSCFACPSCGSTSGCS